MFEQFQQLVFTLVAYVTSVLMSDAGLAAPVAIFFGLCAAVALGVAVEALVYRPLAKASGTLSLLTVLIARWASRLQGPTRPFGTIRDWQKSWAWTRTARGSAGRTAAMAGAAG